MVDAAGRGRRRGAEGLAAGDEEAVRLDRVEGERAELIAHDDADLRRMGRRALEDVRLEVGGGVADALVRLVGGRADRLRALRVAVRGLEGVGGAHRHGLEARRARRRGRLVAEEVVEREEVVAAEGLLVGARRVAGLRVDRVLHDVERARVRAARHADRAPELVAVDRLGEAAHQGIQEGHLARARRRRHRVDEEAPEEGLPLVALERGEHRVDVGVAAVPDAVHGLAEARDQEASEVAAAVEAGHVLVQLALHVAVPAVLGGEPLEDEDVAELASEVVALVGGRRLVVPVGDVALGRVDRLGHGDDLGHLERVAGAGDDAPGELDRDAARRVAGDAARLLRAGARRDGDDELASPAGSGSGSGS